MKINVLYVIYNIGEGKGGHSISMGDTISSLPFINYNVLNISEYDCESLKALGGNLYYKIPPSINIFSVLQKIKSYIDSVNIDLIHAFDDFSYMLCSLVNRLYFRGKLRIMLTKCGGPNPKYNVLYPGSTNTILFSRENYNWFAKNRKSKIYLIPNRIKKIKSRRSSLIEKLVSKERLELVCISRITPYYEKKIFSSIKLIEYLNELGCDASLTIIGSVVSNELYLKLVQKANLSGKLNIIVDAEHTHLSSEFIHYFDGTVSTGRGVMESCYSNKITFVPVKNYDYPEFLCSDNISDLFAFNFSERSTTKSYSSKKILESNDVNFEVEEDVKAFTENNFKLSSVNNVYHDIYSNVMSDNKDEALDIKTVICAIYFIYRQITIKTRIGFKGKIK